MDINVRQLLSGETDKLTFSYKMPVDHEENGYVLDKEADVSGVIRDMGGYMQLDADCVIGYETECARCLKKLNGSCSITFSRPVAVKLEAGNEEEEYVLVGSNSTVNIDDILVDELIMSLPYRSLCSESCKGLCPKCGCNRNEKECSCVTKEIDPRWAVLKDFGKDGKTNG